MRTQDRIEGAHPLGDIELSFETSKTYLEHHGFMITALEDNTWEMISPRLGEKSLVRKGQIILRAEMILSVELQQAWQQHKRDTTPFFCVACGEKAVGYCDSCDTPICQQHNRASSDKTCCPACMEQMEAAFKEMERHALLEKAARKTEHKIQIDGDLPDGHRLKRSISVRASLYDGMWVLWGKHGLHGDGATKEEAIDAFKYSLVYNLKYYTSKEGTYDDLTCMKIAQDMARDELAYLRSIITMLTEEG